MLKKALAAALLTAALFTACTSKEKEGATAAPDLTLKDLSGKDVKLADQKGKVVLLEFWATWCPPCRESIPALEKLHAAYSGKGLKVLAVSMDEGGWDKVRTFAIEHKITYTVLRGTDDAAEKYSLRLIPATYLVDKQGIIRKRYIGEINEEQIEKDVKALL